MIGRYQSQIRGGQSESTRSKYYDLDPGPIVNTGPFQTYGRNGQGLHPVHGATSPNDNLEPDDKDSTNFGVDRQKGWKCWAHDDGGGALQLIAVLEGIRDCGNAADVIQDPEDALRVCLAARDEYSSDLDDEDPPTVAHHKAQVHAYMYGLTEDYDRQITDSVVIYGSRETFDLEIFHVKFDPVFWRQTTLDWAESHSTYRLRNDLPPPSPIYDGN